MKHYLLISSFFLCCVMQAMQEIDQEYADWLKLEPAIKQPINHTSMKLVMIETSIQNLLANVPLSLMSSIGRDEVNFYMVVYNKYLADIRSTYKKEIADACKQFRINGYSVLSMAMVDTDDYYAMNHYQDKRSCVQGLLNFGFKPTPKDQAFAYLELYSRTQEYTQKRLLVYAGWYRYAGTSALKNPQSIFAIMPLEIILYIMKYITEEPLIPRQLCANCKFIKQY